MRERGGREEEGFELGACLMMVVMHRGLWEGGTGQRAGGFEDTND